MHDSKKGQGRRYRPIQREGVTIINFEPPKYFAKREAASRLQTYLREDWFQRGLDLDFKLFSASRPLKNPGMDLAHLMGSIAGVGIHETGGRLRKCADDESPRLACWPSLIWRRGYQPIIPCGPSTGWPTGLGPAFARVRPYVRSGRPAFHSP